MSTKHESGNFKYLKTLQHLPITAITTFSDSNRQTQQIIYLDAIQILNQAILENR